MCENSSYLSIFAAKDSHIDYIKNNPESLYWYINGGILKSFVNPPEDWPKEMQIEIGPNITDQNVSLYHYILNGTTTAVSGSGSIFQTWLTPDKHSAIDLTGTKQHFAFKSQQLVELVSILNNIQTTVLKERITKFLFDAAYEFDPEEQEIIELIDKINHELLEFRKAIAQVLKSGCGIIWISS